VETVLRKISVVWAVMAGQARTNERVAGIVAPRHANGVGNNPIAISAYYVGAVFGISCVKKVNASLSAVRIYGSLDAARWPDAGEASEAMVTMNKDLAQGASVIRYPIGISSAIGTELAPRMLPRFLMLEYTVAGAAGLQLALEIRATFIGSPPFGGEPDDYAGDGD